MQHILSISAGLIFKKQSVNELQLFIKDPYGNPYIPGSSIKGVLRTAILAKKIKEEKYFSFSIIEKIRDFRGNPKSFLNSENEDVQRILLHSKKGMEKQNDMVNDCMSGIRISDSNAVPVNCLTICQKIDRRIDGNIKTLPLMRECIKPNVEFEFQLSIDETETDIGVDYIISAIK